MTDKEKIRELLEASPDGTISTEQVRARDILTWYPLYLRGYSDRTPAQYTMTFPKGYNSPSLKQEGINIKRVVLKNYFLA